MSLSKKIIFQVVVTSLVLFIAIFAFLNHSLQSYVSKSEWSLLDEKSESLKSQISIELNTISQTIKDIDSITSSRLDDSEFVLDTLTELSKLFPDTNGFYAGLEDGSYFDGGGWEPEEGWDARTRDWYKEGKNAKETVFYTEPYMDSQTGLTCVSITKALYDNGRFSGVVSFDYDFNIIQQLITSKLQNNQICFIINDKGSFVYHKDYTVEENLNSIEKGKYKNFSKKIISGNFDFTSTEFLGTRYYFAAKNVPGTDWHLVFGVTKAEVEKSSRRINLVLIIGFVVLFVVLVFVISFSLSRSIKPLKVTAESFRDISKGNADLTKRLEVQKKDEIGDVVNGFNEFVEKLQNIVSGIKNSNNVLSQVDKDLQNCTDRTESAISEILTSVNDVGQQILLQVKDVEDTSGAVETISQDVSVLDRTIENQSDSVAQASAAVEQMIGNITSVNNSVSKMYNSFEEFNQQAQNGLQVQNEVDNYVKQILEQSKMLQEANTVIASIASQTNLLAMNAAIESAHAGEAGKGFSVVADEIRKLSETSQSQSKAIGVQLSNVAQTIQHIVASASASSDIFKSVTDKIQLTNELVRQIKAAMDEQEIGSKQILDSLKVMSNATIDVQTSSDSIIHQQNEISSKVSALLQITEKIKDSVQYMEKGTSQIENTGKLLSEISAKMENSISVIGGQINEFLV